MFAGPLESAALLRWMYLKEFMKRSIALETSSAIRFDSSRGFPAPNILRSTKLMLNANVNQQALENILSSV
jgi:hypothetical protein